MNATIIKAVTQTTRPSFLVLTPVCIFLGLSSVLQFQSWLSHPVIWLIFAGAISSHISVNALNEYHDFKSGLDLKTDRTPFSGGSGALPDNPDAVKLTLIVGLISLLFASLTGLYLVLKHGNLVLPIGVAGLVLIVTYTKWINQRPILCLIAPGIGFGILMIVGSAVVITGEHLSLPWLVSSVPFFLINNLLLLNQYPDINADKSVGRRTFPIAYGIKNSNIVYAIFSIVPYALIVFYIFMGLIPVMSAIALLPMLLSLYSLRGAIKYSANIGSYPQYLGTNVAAAILTPLLLGVAILNG